MQGLRESGKRTAGWLLSRIVPELEYRNCLFVLAHMRCGSTALSNIICSRPDVSGYGESHVRHDGKGALGRLVINQMRRGGRMSGAPILFDKILHSRHDCTVPAEFFEARAIFMVRRPGDAISSIVKLFDSIGKSEYKTNDHAAAYYTERLSSLVRLWDCFPPNRRIGLTHDCLMSMPDEALARISSKLAFDVPLENRYVSIAASRKGGGGDPIVSGRYDRIETFLNDGGGGDACPVVSPALMDEARGAYQKLLKMFEC